ncbi:MAG: hypothetical protein NPIRA05_01780 [Nitrospirales bacterium]|nr:MAG: hypothetical protein NPIRA05_01780 [Nitrospirales bacterium]
MFITTIPYLSEVTINIIGRAPHLTLETWLDQLCIIEEQARNLTNRKEQINDILCKVQYNKARFTYFTATMPHPHTSQSANDIDQFGAIIERINTAMLTLDQLIIRTHKLSTKTNDVPDPSHQSS